MVVSVVKQWAIHQMDVKNAFLHGELKETVYMKPPLGYCTDLQLWKQGVTILLFYVDDILITEDDIEGISRLQQLLSESFKMKDLGPLTYFLGLEVNRNSRGYFVNQQKYAADLVKLANLSDYKIVDTPLELNLKPSKDDGSPLEDTTLYRQLVGSLIYLTMTQSSIFYAVQIVSQFVSSPRQPCLSAVHWIIRYVRGTLPHGIFFSSSSPIHLMAYADADWAGCPDTDGPQLAGVSS
ncbi:PREDICTED: uncharacterized protein LOC109114838 [Nelumbo nucifera]|uniref:Uncharacterized protein LOC109114838 n=1 Tax=Nelumbo nucifera TaxID=4432 RepID=A0A1U8Q6F5_NELNU|nr:PREDICTED: uncharacterized protein LOC109114838 [Nelumbo nucifera]